MVNAYTCGVAESDKLKDRAHRSAWLDLLMPQEILNMSIFELRERTAMGATATIEKPNVGDKVKVELEGEFVTSVYGDPKIKTADGKAHFIGGIPQGAVKVVEKSIPELPPYSIVRSGTAVYGDTYVRVGEGQWRHVNPGQRVPSTLVRSWSDIKELASKVNNVLCELVPVPLSYQPRDLKQWKYYGSTDGTLEGYKVGTDGTLHSDNAFGRLKKDESIQLARDILRANGLKA